MRSMRIRAGLLSLVLSCLATTIAWAQTGKTVTFATDAEKPGGFLLEITTQALKEAGYDTHVDFVPWARALSQSYDGDVDGLLGCLYSDERAQKLIYSDVVAESPYVLFALKDSGLAYHGISDLRSHSVGLINGGSYPKELTDDQQIKKEYASSFQQNLQKLQAKRIDTFLEKKFAVLNYLKAQAPADAAAIVVLDPPLVVNKFYVAFSRKKQNAEQLAADFNQGLAKLKADGGYAAIMSKGLHE